MSNDLSPIKDKSDDELREMSTAMRQYLTAENEPAFRTALDKLNQKKDLINRIFPTAVQKEQQRIVVQRMRSKAQAQEAMYKLYTDVQLEIARRQSTAFIALVDLDLRAKLSIFATAKLAEVTQAIAASRNRFVERIMPEMENAERFRDIPALHKFVDQSVQKEIETFFAITDKLLDAFNDAIESKLESLRR